MLRKYLSLPADPVPDVRHQPLEAPQLLDVAHLVADPQFAGVVHPRTDTAAPVAQCPGDARLAGHVLDVPAGRPRPRPLERGVAQFEPAVQEVVDVPVAEDDVAAVPAVGEVDARRVPNQEEWTITTIAKRFRSRPGGSEPVTCAATDEPVDLANIHYHVRA